MVVRFINAVASIFKGSTGIKQAYVGEAKVYDRGGAYFYLTLKHEEV